MPVPNLFCISCPLTPKQKQIFESMERLWLEHVYWMRALIVSTVFGLEDQEEVTNRLMSNPKDFAEILKPLYGEAAAEKFEKLMKGYLNITGKLVSGLKISDTPIVDAFRLEWFENADEISAYLNSINPNWSKKVWQDVLYNHLEMTENEADYMINELYSASVNEFSKIEKQALDMANYMAGGILKQFKI